MRFACMHRYACARINRIPPTLPSTPPTYPNHPKPLKTPGGYPTGTLTFPEELNHVMTVTPLAWVGDQVVLEDDTLAEAITRIGAETLTVPGTHIAAPAAPAEPTAVAPAELTAVAVTETNAVSPANAAYTQADQTALADLVNSLKVQINHLVTDVGIYEESIDALVTDVGVMEESIDGLVTKVAAILTALQTAGILAAS